MTAAAPAGTPALDVFRHEAFLYRGLDEFVRGLSAVVREGLDAGDAVVVAEPPDRLGLLRDALGSETDDVRWLDISRVGTNPGRLVGVWATALAEARATGRVLRGIAEPAFPGRRPQELAECHLHELLLHEAFADGPGWLLVCPYDEGSLPSATLAGAHRSHTRWSSVAARGATGAGGEELAEDLAAASSAPLPAPGSPVLRGDFGPTDVPAVRHTVATWARSVRLPADQVELLELVASELATNAVEHGGGAGTVALWAEPGAVVVEVRDAGPGTGPLAGRRPPEGDDPAGLYLLHQLCDLVQVRSSAAGTTVRVTTWR